MASTRNNKSQTYKTDRREFCKKAPCVAMGIMASSSVFPNFPGDLPLPENSILKNEQIMANIVTAKVISQKGSCGLGHKVVD